MIQSKQAATQTPRQESSRGDARVQMSKLKRSISGAVGYDAQAAALAPAEQEGLSTSVGDDAPVQRLEAGGGSAGGIVQRMVVQRRVVNSGPELVEVQEKLNKAGFDCGNADGIWGPKTMAAVKAFQQSKGLTPDGAVGPMTLAALDSAAGGGGGAATKGGGGSGAPKPVDDKPTTKAGDEVAKGKGKGEGGKAGAGDKAGTGGKAGAGAKDAKGTPAGDKGAAGKADSGSGAAAGGGKPEAAPPPEEKKEAKPVSGTRQAVAAAAFAEVGKVRAKDSSGKDPDGKPARVGWERLSEYFNVAFGGGWKDQDLLVHQRGGTKMEHGTGKQVATADTLPSWCGIFAIWAVKTAGFSVGTWGLGKAAPNIMKGQHKVPEVGDVVVSPNHNHHAVVVWVAPDAAEKAAQGKANSIEIKTVDGNSGSNPVSGGEVVDKGSSTMSKWAWGAWTPE